MRASTCFPFDHRRPQPELSEASMCQNLVKALYFKMTLIKLILRLNPVEIKLLDTKNALQKRSDCPFVLILLMPQTLSPLMLSVGVNRYTSCNPYACDFCGNEDFCIVHRHSNVYRFSELIKLNVNVCRVQRQSSKTV